MVAIVRDTIHDYYAALRAGDPIHPFFVDTGPVVKVGIGERLIGARTVADGLREQTRTTTDWTIESRDLHVGVIDADGAPREEDDPSVVDGDEGTPDGHALAWFGDDVAMGWTDTGRGRRYAFDTRWSGALVHLEDGWTFVEMHVSAPGAT